MKQEPLEPFTEAFFLVKNILTDVVHPARLDKDHFWVVLEEVPARRSQEEMEKLFELGPEINLEVCLSPRKWESL